MKSINKLLWLPLKIIGSVLFIALCLKSTIWLFWLVGRIVCILLIILFYLLLFILLILALPFHITASCSFSAEKFDYQLQLRWAWLLDLTRLIENQLWGTKTARPQRTVSAKKRKSRRTKVKTIPGEPEPAAHNGAAAVFRNEPAKPAAADRPHSDRLDSETKSETAATEAESEAEAPNSSLGSKFQEIMDYLRLGMQYKDLFFTFLLKFFRLLHIRPLQLQGQFGLADPADTAFLFSACYTLLPFLPFCYFTVEPVFTDSTCDLNLTLKCRISITEILLHLLLDKDLRRPLIQVYKLYKADKL